MSSRLVQNPKIGQEIKIDGSKKNLFLICQYFDLKSLALGDSVEEWSLSGNLAPGTLFYLSADWLKLLV